jgi:hypothetical protein
MITGDFRSIRVALGDASEGLLCVRICRSTSASRGAALRALETLVVTLRVNCLVRTRMLGGVGRAG